MNKEYCDRCLKDITNSDGYRVEIADARKYTGDMERRSYYVCCDCKDAVKKFMQELNEKNKK